MTGRPRRPWRSFGARGLAVVLSALVLVAVAPASAARAADDTLRLEVATTYRIDPAGAAVHVSLDITATSLAADTDTQIFFYNALRFAVQRQARGFAASSGSLTLPVETAASNGVRTITISIPDLYYRRSLAVHLTFDLPAGKPRSPSPIRVGQAHADFVAWAWGDPGLADVRIIIPNRFSATVQALPAGTRDPVTSIAVGGHREYGASAIHDPARWYAAVDASDSAALTDVPLKLDRERVTIHAWPEDREWLQRVSGVLESGLPALETAIGLPWPVPDELRVVEVTSAEIEGYAGIYDSAADEIRISEDLDPLVIVHEASHAWFDDRLFKERWITEGLADEYASRVLDPGADTVRQGPNAVTPDDPAAFPLNGWPPPSRVDSQTEATESYGYDASWTVVRAIVSEVSEARMRDVFAAAAAGTIPYVGALPAERSASAPDWRRFLDLVQEIGGSTSAADLVAEWVATPGQEAELEARTVARSDYADLLATGGTWLPGPVVRRAMTDWQFDDAEQAIDRSAAILEDRDRLHQETTALGLALPAELESAYEASASTDDLATLDTTVGDWQVAADAIDSARAALAADRDPLETLGLYDTTPSAGYDAARLAFSSGDEAAAMSGATTTLQLLAGAGTSAAGGRSRSGPASPSCSWSRSSSLCSSGADVADPGPAPPAPP